MNLNYFLRFYKLRKLFRYLIFSNSEKRKIISDVSSCITETLNGYKLVRNEIQRMLQNMFQPIDVIFEHHKHNKNCYFTIDKTFMTELHAASKILQVMVNVVNIIIGQNFFVKKRRYEAYKQLFQNFWQNLLIRK